MKTTAKNGFTTIEVLVTLFVGVMLIGGGYQLYSIITQTSATTRNQTDASNIVYEQLRNYSAQISGSCVVSTTNDISAEIPSYTVLPGTLAMNLSRTCPFGAGEDISLITVKLTYGEEGARHDVSHALYAR